VERNGNQSRSRKIKSRVIFHSNHKSFCLRFSVAFVSDLVCLVGIIFHGSTSERASEQRSQEVCHEPIVGLLFIQLSSPTAISDQIRSGILASRTPRGEMFYFSAFAMKFTFSCHATTANLKGNYTCSRRNCRQIDNLISCEESRNTKYATFVIRDVSTRQLFLSSSCF
jgi:hypothetical protein